MLKYLVLVGLLGLFASQALAHGHHHHHEHVEDIYAGVVEQNFFLEGGPLAPTEESYVLLPDGTHYSLNSKFWRATLALAKILDDDHNEDPSWYPAPWQRLSDFGEEMTHKKFWLRLSGAGSEYLLRYGPVTLTMIAAAELLEHSFWPAPGACIAIQSACVATGKHLKRFWSLVRYRFPIAQGVDQRIQASAQQLKWNWHYWRAMKKIKTYSAADFPLAEPEYSPYVAYFLAQEKSAFLEMQLNVAKEAADHLLDHHSFIYLRLSAKFAQMGKAIDNYSIYLAGMAMTDQATDRPEHKEIDQKFSQFFESLVQFFSLVKRGSLPLTTPLGKAIWKGPAELIRSIAHLQKTGCQELLEPKDEEIEEPLLHSPPQHFHHAH